MTESLGLAGGVNPNTVIDRIDQNVSALLIRFDGLASQLAAMQTAIVSSRPETKQELDP